MKLTSLPVILFVVVCCLLFAQDTRAQGVYGYTSLDYDDASGVVTAYSETDLDYEVMGDYDAYVSMSVTDDFTSIVASGSARDPFCEGFISITLQFNGSADTTYTARGVHKAYANYNDYDFEDFYPYRSYIYYWDSWYFGFFEGQGIYQPWYYYFFSPGYNPIRRRNRYVALGSTIDYAVLTIRAPHPVHFQLLESRSFNDGRLYSKYTWESSDGHLENLNNCTVGEFVTNPARGATFTWPKPPFDCVEPASGEITVPGTSGFLEDNYLPPCNGFVWPYRYSTFTTTQIYRYTCSSINGGRPVTLKGPIRIVRTVAHDGEGGTWTYKCSVPGRSASTNIGGF